MSKTKEHDAIHHGAISGELDTLPKTHTHIMMTQLKLQAGLKAYGEKGDEAIMKEIAQLHTRKSLLPCDRNDMTYDERKKALRYLMFLKENVRDP